MLLYQYPILKITTRRLRARPYQGRRVARMEPRPACLRRWGRTCVCAPYRRHLRSPRLQTSATNLRFRTTSCALAHACAVTRTWTSIPEITMHHLRCAAGMLLRLKPARRAGRYYEPDCRPSRVLVSIHALADSGALNQRRDKDLLPDQFDKIHKRCLWFYISLCLHSQAALGLAVGCCRDAACCVSTGHIFVPHGIIGGLYDHRVTAPSPAAAHRLPLEFDQTPLICRE